MVGTPMGGALSNPPRALCRSSAWHILQLYQSTGAMEALPTHSISTSSSRSTSP